MKISLVIITILVTLFVLLLIMLGPKPKSFEITNSSMVVNENFKGFFEESLNSQIDVKALKNKYDSTRKSALNKANQFIRQRNFLTTLFHGICIATIFVSFIITYLGAGKGVVVTSESVAQNLDALKQETAGFKKSIIILSALTVLFTTIGNRVSVYADQSQNKAESLIEMIKAVDAKINLAINVKDAQIVINSFELDITKY